MATLKVRNWDKFQHFKDRRPVWVKLYREILDDLDINSLSSDAFKFMIQVWLIASENDGNLPMPSELAWRLRISEKKCEQLLLDLLDVSLIEEGANEPLGKGWGTRYISKEVKEAVLTRDCGKCVTCKSKENIEFDHIVPVSAGGTSEAENIQLLCRSCNRKKRAKLHAEPSATQMRSPRALAREETEGEKEKRKTPHTPQGVVEDIFETWKNERSHPQAILDDKRRRAIKSRLEEGYSSDRIKAAIRGIKRSPHHMGKNDRDTVYDDIELICRTGKNVDTFADLEEKTASKSKPLCSHDWKYFENKTRKWRDCLKCQKFEPLENTHTAAVPPVQNSPPSEPSAEAVK